MSDYTQSTVARYQLHINQVNGLLNGLKDPEKLRKAVDDLDTQLDDIQFQPRYRLLLYLSEHWDDLKTAEPCPTITMAYAKDASSDALEPYAEKLSRLTKRLENRNVSPQKETFFRCMDKNITDPDTWRSIALGLRLDYWETEDLFLRVLPDFDGFNFRRIDELCLVFALELDKTISEYHKLVTACRNRIKSCQNQKIPVVNDRYGTESARKDLLFLLDQWRETPAQQEEQLLQWVAEHWTFFDGGRYTAKYVYYALAQLCTSCDPRCFDEANCPTLTDLTMPLSERIAEHQLAPSREEADHIAERLLTLEEPYQGWLAVQGTKVKEVLKRNAKRTILRNLLPPENGGTKEVSKRDLLMLLWTLAVQLWTSAGGRPDLEALQNRADDFANAADYLLTLAQLPEFYWPHPLEYSMLLSILSGSTVNMMYYYLLKTAQTEAAPERDKET